MTKEDHARTREYRDRVGAAAASGEAPSEQLGQRVAAEMAAEGRPLPKEIAQAAGWAA